ncbi:MAG: hypothetical protein AB7V18_02260 [Pyrinomonadaceae bacterium]
MSSIHDFAPGDFLIFQLEAGFALLRVLDVQAPGGDAVWHISVYRDLFLDTETADAALDEPEKLGTEIAHAALTNRAFESSQMALMRNVPLTADDLVAYEAWKRSAEPRISDRSVRLLLGLR